jgi:hypothetical protein
MFDIVTTHDDQLPLPVDLEGIHHPEPLLTAAATRQLDSTAENQPEQDEYERHADQKAQHGQYDGQCAIFSEETHRLHVLGSLGSARRKPIKLS